MALASLAGDEVGYVEAQLWRETTWPDDLAGGGIKIEATPFCGSSTISKSGWLTVFVSLILEITECIFMA